MSLLRSDFFFLYLPGALVTAFVGTGLLVNDKPRLRALGALVFVGGIAGILSTMAGVTTTIAHVLGVG